jgi:hypothetical protein
MLRIGQSHSVFVEARHHLKVDVSRRIWHHLNCKGLNNRRFPVVLNVEAESDPAEETLKGKDHSYEAILGYAKVDHPDTFDAEAFYRDVDAFLADHVQTLRGKKLVVFEDGSSKLLAVFLATLRYDTSSPENIASGTSALNRLNQKYLPETALRSTGNRSPGPRELRKQDTQLFDRLSIPSPDEISKNIDAAEEGISVSMKGAEYAIAGTMDAYSALNSARHLRDELKDKDSRLVKLYGREAAGRIVQGKHNEATGMARAISSHLDTLTAADAQRAKGMAEEDIRLQRREVLRTLSPFKAPEMREARNKKKANMADLAYPELKKKRSRRKKAA